MNTITRPGYILIDTKGKGAARYIIKNANTGEWEFFSNSSEEAIEALDRLVEYGVPYFNIAEAIEEGYDIYDTARTSEYIKKDLELLARIRTAGGSRKGELYFLTQGSKTGKWYRRYLRKEDE